MRKTVPKMTWAFAVLSLLALPARAAPGHPGDPAAVVAAERAFAARAAEVGVAPSFLEFMTDDAIVFSPDPLLAKAVYGVMPPPKLPKDGGTRLSWWPNFAGVARSGDLAFTTGPATVNGGKPGIFYFTVWSRQKDGGWKWVYDGGVEADGSNAPGPDVKPIALAPSDAKPMRPDEARMHLSFVEDDLAKRAKTDLVAAYRTVLAADARVQDSKNPPASTPATIDRELATRPKTISFGPLGGSVSQAGDLAWTYGDAKWETGRGHYVRVWQRRASGWKLVFDEIIPLER